MEMNLTKIMADYICLWTKRKFPHHHQSGWVLSAGVHHVHKLSLRSDVFGESTCFEKDQPSKVYFMHTYCMYLCMY